MLLKWVYGKIRRFEEDGYKVILVGNPDHAEIIASRSYGTGIRVVYSDEDVDKLRDDLGPKTVAICQTTITRDKFQHLVERIRATKYPNLTRRYFAERGIQVEVVRLDGSIELAPLVGLAERIVDLVQSGETLRANGLVEVAEILPSTARLITSRAAARPRAPKSVSEGV